ncbi:MAG: hypothetical protein ACRC10_09545, partial [Thermoguttaceae bacterium]
RKNKSRKGGAQHCIDGRILGQLRQIGGLLTKKCHKPSVRCAPFRLLFLPETCTLTKLTMNPYFDALALNRE